MNLKNFTVKKLLSSYYLLLCKDKLFLVWNFALPALFVAGYFLSLHNPVSIICWTYIFLVNVGCIYSFLCNINKEIAKKSAIYNEEKQHLNFWLNECNRLFAEYVKAESEFRVTDAINFVKQYENAAKRYGAELQKSADKYGIKVKIDRV